MLATLIGKFDSLLSRIPRISACAVLAQIHNGARVRALLALAKTVLTPVNTELATVRTLLAIARVTPISRIRHEADMFNNSTRREIRTCTLVNNHCIPYKA